MRTEKKNQYKLTEFLSQFEMNAEMDTSKNQWRSTGGLDLRKHKKDYLKSSIR